MRDLDIMSVNSDGSVSSTTGHVEDSKAAVAPVIPGEEKDEPAKDYETDADGNLIDPDTGEIIAPGETETGTDTTDPSAPQQPGTENPGTGTETPGTGSSETGSGSTEEPGQSEDPGIIVVPTEPGDSGTQITDPVTGEPLPPEA